MIKILDTRRTIYTASLEIEKFTNLNKPILFVVQCQPFILQVKRIWHDLSIDIDLKKSVSKKNPIPNEEKLEGYLI